MRVPRHVLMYLLSQDHGKFNIGKYGLYLIVINAISCGAASSTFRGRILLSRPTSVELLKSLRGPT
jgi:hypothetical protein